VTSKSAQIPIDPGASERPNGSPHRSRLEKCLSAVVFGGLTILPFVISLEGLDSYRLPKELAFRAFAIVLTTVLLLGLVFDENFRHRCRTLPRAVIVVPLAAVIWTGITAMASTRPAISFGTLGWVAGAALVFLAAFLAFSRSSVQAAAVLLVPATLMSAACIGGHLASSLVSNDQPGYRPALEVLKGGFLGNSNDFGPYLVASMVVAAALYLVSRNRLCLTAAIVIAAAIVINGSLTAIVATAAGLLAMLFLLRTGLAWRATAVLVVTLVGAALLYPPLRQRITSIKLFIAQGQYDAVITYRTTSFLAAWKMFLDHPLVGVGPGCFSWNYYPYKLQLEIDYPALQNSAQRTYNFGEVHNDHLQVLSTTGLPGYAIFVAALALMASSSKRAKEIMDPTKGQQFARHAGLPLGLAFAVTAMMAFPLELAAPLTQWLASAAAAVAWRKV